MQLESLIKMQKLLKNLYWKGKGNPLPFERGIECGIKSLTNLHTEIVNEGYSYLLTRRMNQVSI